MQYGTKADLIIVDSTEAGYSPKYDVQRQASNRIGVLLSGYCGVWSRWKET